MAAAPRWEARTGRKTYFGLDFVPGGSLDFAFVRNESRRVSTVCVNRPDLKLRSLNPGKLQVQYVSRRKPRASVNGQYLVKLQPKSPGWATCVAEADGQETQLAVLVGEQIPVKVNFRAVQGDGWDASSGLAKARRFLTRANQVFRWQGNLNFRQFGSPKVIQMPKMPESTGSKKHLEVLRKRSKKGADVTVFFVEDYNRPGPSDGLGRSYEDIILLEAATSSNDGRDAKIFCHEMGHFLGLGHPKPPAFRNLMNTKSNASPEYVKLASWQMAWIRMKANWRNSIEYCCLLK